MTPSEITDAMTTSQLREALRAFVECIDRLAAHRNRERFARELDEAMDLCELLAATTEPERDGRFVLTPHQVERVLASNESSYTLARELNCASSTIRMMRRKHRREAA